MRKEMTRSFALIGMLALLCAAQANSSVLTVLPTHEHVIALTFDACEAGQRAHLDHRIADFLVARQIPFTVFMGGKFARDNEADAKWLAAQPFVDIENHSFSHNNHMDRLSQAAVQKEVVHAADEIARVTRRSTSLFRFPAGNYSPASLATVEALGYRVVHWRWAVGDPDPRMSAAAIERRVAAITKPGDILIMHINGRGVHTAEALPAIVAKLSAEGYRFETVSSVLSRGPHA